MNFLRCFQWGKFNQTISSEVSPLAGNSAIPALFPAPKIHPMPAVCHLCLFCGLYASHSQEFAELSTTLWSCHNLSSRSAKVNQCFPFKLSATASTQVPHKLKMEQVDLALGVESVQDGTTLAGGLLAGHDVSSEDLKVWELLLDQVDHFNLEGQVAL